MQKTVSSYETVNTTYLAIEAVTQDNYFTKKNVQEIQKITYSLPNGLYIFVEHLRKNLYPPPRAPTPPPSNQHRTFNQLNAIPIASTDKIALPQTLSFFLVKQNLAVARQLHIHSFHMCSFSPQALWS